MKLTTLFSLSLVSALVTPVFGGPLFSDDFNDGNDTGWTRYEPLLPFGAGATYSFTGGGYRVQSPPSPNPGQLGINRVGAVRTDITLDSFRVSVDILDWNDSIETAIGIGARVSDMGLGTTDGYFAHINAGGTDEIRIDRITNEAPVFPVVAALSVDLPAPGDVDLQLVFSGEGSLLTLELFDLANLSSPLASISGIDETHISGHVGVLTAGLVDERGGFDNAPLDATFDNFTVVPEPTTSMLFLMGLAATTISRRLKFGWALRSR